MNPKTRWTISALPLLVLLAAIPVLADPSFARKGFGIDPDGGRQLNRMVAVSTGIDPDGYA